MKHVVAKSRRKRNLNESPRKPMKQNLTSSGDRSMAVLIRPKSAGVRFLLNNNVGSPSSVPRERQHVPPPRKRNAWRKSGKQQRSSETGNSFVSNLSESKKRGAGRRRPRLVARLVPSNPRALLEVRLLLAMILVPEAGF